MGGGCRRIHDPRTGGHLEDRSRGLGGGRGGGGGGLPGPVGGLVGVTDVPNTGACPAVGGGGPCTPPCVPRGWGGVKGLEKSVWCEERGVLCE